MKCLFLDIGYDFEELDEPLGIEVLSSFVRSRFDNIEVDEFCSNYEDVDYTALLAGKNPDIIAISTHVNTWERLRILHQHIKTWKKDKEVLLLIGGTLVSFEYERVIQEYPEAVCMIGEGEDAMETVLKYAQKEPSVCRLKELLIENECPNVAFEYPNKGLNRSSDMRSDNDSTKCIYIGHRCVREDLSGHDFIVTHTYLGPTVSKDGIVRMEAGRGCPWNKCSFCVLRWKYAGAGWRPYSIKKIISELMYLSDHGAKTIYFTDEEFIGPDLEHLNKLIDGIILLRREGRIASDIELVASTSVQALSGRYGIPRENIFSLLVKMKEAGFRSFFLGVESGSDSQLTRFRKGITVAETEEIIELLKKYEIETDIGYILFDPLMNITELKESLDFLKRTGLYKDLSRFAKRLRVVPHTVYCDTYNVNKTGYSEESVEYTYEFNDPQIREIYSCYTEWEKEHLAYTHQIQSEIRASVKNDVRNDRIDDLKHIRSREYYALRYIVDSSLNGVPAEYISVETINDYLDKLVDFRHC